MRLNEEEDVRVLLLARNDMPSGPRSHGHFSHCGVIQSCLVQRMLYVLLTMCYTRSGSEGNGRTDFLCYVLDRTLCRSAVSEVGHSPICAADP